MNRLEIISELKQLEERKKDFQNLFSDIDDYYHKETYIMAVNESRTFKNKLQYNSEHIKVDLTLFKDYIKEEIMTLEEKINEYISRLRI